MGKFMRDGSGSWGWSRFRGAGRVGRTCSSEYGRIMIRPTRHPATMPHRAVPRQRGLAGLVLLLLGMSVLSVCVAGYADAGTSQMAGSGWSAAGPAGGLATGKPAVPLAGAQIQSLVPAASGQGEGRCHSCCSHDVPPAIDVAARYPEGRPAPTVPATAPAHPAAPESPLPGVAGGRAPPTPSLLKLSISRT